MKHAHFHFGDLTSCYLIDNLVRGIYEAGYITTMWPDRPWLYSKAPVLTSPQLQGWGGSDWTSGWLYVEGRHIDETSNWVRRVCINDVCIVTHSHSNYWFPALKEGVVKVAIDAYDKPLYAWRDAARSAGYVVFAREAIREGEYPIDYPFNPLWKPVERDFRDRTFSVILQGDMGVGNRRQYADVIRTMKLPTLPILPSVEGRSLSYGEWQEALSRSRICVCPHGSGETTYRLFESMAAGCAVLVEDFIDRPRPSGLIDGETCLFFKPGDVEDFRGKLQTLAWNMDLCQRVARAGEEEALRNHTPKAVAEYILSVVTR